ncbi:MAG: 23S rRNA (adenine(2503)-C(2))-methyltransferase RlmN [Candidatus Omnitrophica bacterium]|nr:23S rRNA (adenine(2503)-C(2))-methyltransferase RlmN [Candidatus Omnitrophota bacterium]
MIEGIGGLGIEKFRAGQILEWVYKKHARGFDEMTNLPAALKGLLKEKFFISCLKPSKELISKDGTKKFLFELEDGERIESVFIPSRNTKTVCVSSQVGCKFACGFCASGMAGFRRNLRPAEMVNQVLYAGAGLKPAPAKQRVVTNIVFMGMGEPLDNYDNVLKAIRIINAPYGLNIGQRKITISTSGVAPAIRRLIDEGLRIELSVSLHAPTDNLRSRLMGINKRYPIKELMEAAGEYIGKTSRQVTFEYIMIKGVNDTDRAASELAGLLKGMLAKVNLIPYNPVKGLGYAASLPETMERFKGILEKNKIVSVIRARRGEDIAAACGQLRLNEAAGK